MPPAEGDRAEGSRAGSLRRHCGLALRSGRAGEEPSLPHAAPAATLAPLVPSSPDPKHQHDGNRRVLGTGAPRGPERALQSGLRSRGVPGASLAPHGGGAATSQGAPRKLGWVLDGLSSSGWSRRPGTRAGTPPELGTSGTAPGPAPPAPAGKVDMQRPDTGRRKLPPPAAAPTLPGGRGAASGVMPARSGAGRSQAWALRGRDTAQPLGSLVLSLGEGSPGARAP